MKNKIEIKKVKHNLSGTTIEYFTNDSIVLESSEEPMQSFREAFQSIKPFFMKLCEFEVKDNKDALFVIKGVSFSHNKDGDESVIITATKHLKSGKTITINSPLHSFEDWENALIDVVDNIKKEAIAYINGKRQYEQQSLLVDENFDNSLEEEIEKDKFQQKLNTFDEKTSGIESVTISGAGKSVTLKKKGK